MWRDYPVGKHMNTLSGFAFASSFFNDQEAGLPLIRIRDIDSFETELFYSGSYLDTYLVRNGDILIGMDGEFNIRKWRGDKALLNQRVLKLSEKQASHLDEGFVFYWLAPYLKIVEHQTAATTVKHLSSKDVANAVVRAPDRPIQRKIAHILETTDEAIEKTEVLIAKYEQIKQGMMQDLFTRGVDENGQLRPPYEEAPHLYKETELGWFPKGWRVSSFLSLLDDGTIQEIQDGNHGEQHPKTSDFVEDGVPFLMANNIETDGSIDFETCAGITLKQYNSLRIGFAKPNDVLLTHKGTVGRVGMLPQHIEHVMLTPQVTYYRIGNNRHLSGEYLYFYLSSPSYQSLLKSLSAQSTRAYIGITEQKKQPVILPPQSSVDDEQSRIARILSSTDSFLKAERMRLQKLRAQKAGLMQDLLTGKVRVSLDREERAEAVA